MLSTAASVVQGVVGAGLVASAGAALKRAGVVNDVGAASLSKMIFFLFNPAFAFFSIAQVSPSVLLDGAWIMLSATAVLCVSCSLGMLLLVAWPRQDPVTRVMVLTAVTFSNVGSLPLYLAGSLAALRKPDVFSYLTVYIGTQSFLMWGVFYPSAMLWLARQHRLQHAAAFELASIASEEEGSSPEQQSDAVPPAPPAVTCRSVAGLVFNPVVLCVMAGVLTALVSPLQHFLFVAFPLFARVAETLADCNVGAHLLILGFGLYPFRVATEWRLLSLVTCVRLVIVPAVVFVLYFLLLHPRDLTLAWVPLTLAGTPTNLGVLVIAGMFKSEAAPQILAMSYLSALVTVPFFNIVLLSKFS